MPYGVLADIFCIILGGIIGPNLNIKITYKYRDCLLYTSPSPRDPKTSRMPSSA